MDTITTIQDLMMLNGSVQPVMVALTPSEQSLIAASPTLLMAAKEAKTALAYSRTGRLWPYSAETTERTLTDAIAKAEGRE